MIAKPFKLQMPFLRVRNCNRSKYPPKYHPNLPLINEVLKNINGVLNCNQSGTGALTPVPKIKAKARVMITLLICKVSKLIIGNC